MIASRLRFALPAAAGLVYLLLPCARSVGDPGSEFFESKIRPLLVQHCYECHSEAAGERQGGLLLDRSEGWLEGGDTGKAVVPEQPSASLLLQAVKHEDGLEMPPDDPLDAASIELLHRWIQMGAPGPKEDLGSTEFSQLGDQQILSAKAKEHWAFQPIGNPTPPAVPAGDWGRQPVDAFVLAKLQAHELRPNPPIDPQRLARRLAIDLVGLPPTFQQVQSFAEDYQRDAAQAVTAFTEQLLQSPQFGAHFGRMWLDVARYADTDSTYRPDTKTPHYFPFAFTYRDYVVDAFNQDKPFDRFLQEQLAADLLPGITSESPEIAALGFLAVGPHVNRSQAEALDDWIDVTTRGLMGVTAACARCHDHKYEPVPTADYYALRGVFASIRRANPLDEKKQPLVASWQPLHEQRQQYEKQRAEVDAKILAATGKKAGGNQRSVSEKIRDTELAKLLTFHPGAPARAMRVFENKRPATTFIFVRGDATNRGPEVPRGFLSLLGSQEPFPENQSGRLQVARAITDPENPLTARVFVNRVWGALMGTHLVQTPSDFGLQGEPPTHPQLLDWLARDFIEHEWSVKHLVRQIVYSATYQQDSRVSPKAVAVDPQNRLLWRANRKHLSIEAIRDSMLATSGALDTRLGGRPQLLWDPETYTRRRTLYGFVNRFNLDPTLRAFDFPTPMQTQPARGESIVPTQALFTLNAQLVVDQADRLTSSDAFLSRSDDSARLGLLTQTILQRDTDPLEVERVSRFVKQQEVLYQAAKNPKRFQTPWSMVAQSLLMSNEFQYVD